MLVKQGMNKKQAYDHLKVKLGTIDSIRKNWNLQVHTILGKDDKIKYEIK